MDEELMAEVRSAMTSWGSTHPHASFAEIEEAVEEQIVRIRVRMLEQVVADGPTQNHPVWRACGTTMVPRSAAERQLTVQGDEAVHLRRSSAACPSCGAGLFPPLDEELVLLPSSFSPFVHASIVRLGTLLPEQLVVLTGVTVSRETVRRLTEQAGAAQVAVETEDMRRVPRTESPVLAEGVVQQLSADGAMVPLRGGVWAEVRTLAIGIVGERPGPAGPEVHAHDVSYFSRLCSADAFIDWAALPLHQRATERAQTVVAVGDGAAWLQDLMSAHRPDAVRILDFPHAAGYLSQVAHAAFGAGSREAAVWLDVWLPKLKTTTPEEVVDAIRQLPMPTPEAGETRNRVLAYLRTRLDQLRYASFQERGYPIGSGMVESGNKLVVEARLKGAGMHWARPNVNPLLAFRGLVCSGRWDASWPRMRREMARQAQERRRRGRCRRQVARAEQGRGGDATTPHQAAAVRATAGYRWPPHRCTPLEAWLRSAPPRSITGPCKILRHTPGKLPS